MNNTIKAILATAAIGATAIVGAPTVEANPILNNYRTEQTRLQNLSYGDINNPKMGGTTTLNQKCEALKYFQNNGKLGKSMEMGFQIGFEHSDALEAFGMGGACRKVGVYGIYG